MEISSTALKALIASIRDSASSLVKTEGTPVAATPLSPGSEVLGEVVEKQPNGRYLVRVGPEIFDMPLPRNTPTGKTLLMTFIGDQPRITFSIPQPGAKGSEVTLSGASRWLGSMTSNLTPTANGDGPTVARSTKLFDTLPLDRGAIVERLRNAVTRSGLFYESHVVRWSENSFPLEELLKEPQGQHSPLIQQENTTAPQKTPQPHPSAELPKPQTPAHQSGRDATSTIQEPQEGVEPGSKSRPQDTLSRPGNKDAEPAVLSAGRTDERNTVSNTPQGKTIIVGRTEASTPTTRSEPESSRPRAAAAQSPLTEPRLPSTQQNPRDSSQLSTPVPASPTAKGDKSPEGEPAPIEMGGRTAPPTQGHQNASSQSALSQDGKPLQPTTMRPVTITTLTQDPLATPAAENSKTTQHAVHSDATGTSLPDDQLSSPLAHSARAQTELSSNRKYPFVSPEQGAIELPAPHSRESSLTAGAKSSLLPFEPPDHQTLPIIKQQLELLQSGQFVWHGEPWQGQQLEWMIRRDGNRTPRTSVNGWETSLMLDLPVLGPLSAKVHLSGGEVRITLAASNEKSAAKMEAGRKKLRDGMENAGLNLVSMEVRREAP